jgi:rhamnosyltransferase subunit B
VTQAKIVLATFGSLGDLHPFLALARGLKSRGHAVVMATVETHRARVEDAGISFCPIGPDLAEFGDEATLMAKVMDQNRGVEFIIRKMVMPNLRRSYKEIATVAADAHILVTHPLAYGAQLFAEKNADTIAWVSVALAPSSMWSAYDPPVMPPMPWLNKLRPLGPRFFRLVMSLLQKSLDPWVRPWHALRAELNLPKTSHNPLFEGQFSPTLTLCMFSPRFAQPQPDWVANAHATGFAFYDKPEETSDLDSFLRSGEPPLVFTLGSSAVMDAGNFYTESAKAAQLLGKRALLLIGRDPRNRPTKELPGDILVCDYAPYAKVFPYASVVIHQGGIGTTAEVLRAGKPMLVMPFGFDQFDNAAHAQALGVARTISRKGYQAKAAARELRMLLGDTAIHLRATQFAAALRAEDGVGNACRAIESQLGSRFELT